MRTKSFLKHLILGALLLMTAKVVGQSSVPGNAGAVTDFLGWNNTGTNNFPLMVRHDLNQPIEWYTDSTFRMRLTEAQWGLTVNGYNPINRAGNLGVGPFNNLPGGQPLTRLHLDGGATQVAGFRPWMDIGTTMTAGSDWMYVGLKQRNLLAGDRQDAVINWADNDQFNPNWGPDALRFIFTKDPALGDVSGALNGLEIALMIPDSNGNEGYVGVGDFNTPGLLPNERLDILSRTARLRRLIPDYNNDTIGRIVVVDTTGRLHWRRISSFPTGGGGSGADCDWTLLGPDPSNSNIATAYAGNPGCPQADKNVGIGTTNIQAKLHVYRNTSGGVNQMLGYYQMVGSANDKTAGRFDATGTGVLHQGVYGYAADASGASGKNIGVSGWANDPSESSTLWNIGVNGVATLGHGGYTAQAKSNFAVKAETGTSSTSTLENNYGVWSYANNSATSTGNHGGHFNAISTASALNYGVKSQSTVTNGANWSIGVHSIASGPDTTRTWAGYFTNRVQIQGPLWHNASFIFSDAQLKNGIEGLDAEEANSLLSQLSPKTYHYNSAAYPEMNLPSEKQFGFLAQEVREVLPELVRTTRVAPVVDSAGVVVQQEHEVQGVNYVGMVPLLVAGHQASEQRNDRLEEQLAALVERVSQLEQSLASCCATHGSGDQRMMIEDDGTVTGEARSLRIVPNPFNEGTTLHYTLEKAGRMQLLANSADGKQLKVLHEAQQEAGTYQHAWSTAELSPGVYYVTLLLEGEPIVKKAVKVVR